MAVNYTDKDSITIDDINETPIATGYNYTFSSVFGALNKIIKAIINKFKNVENETDVLHRGKTGVASCGDIDVKSANTTSDIITIDNEHYWTHGYIYVCNSPKNKDYEAHVITPMQPVKKKTYGENVDSLYTNHYGTADITYTIVHNNDNNTCIKVEINATSSYYDFKFSSFDFKYELY